MAGNSNHSLTTVAHLSHRYKDTGGGQVDERGVATDWRPLLSCTDCLRTHLNGDLETDLKEMALADIFLGSCSAFSHFAAVLSSGITVLPSNLYTSKGYSGVLSPNGLQERGLIVHPTDTATFDMERFRSLLKEM